MTCVLIIDDVRTERRATALVLERSGYATLEAQDGAQGLELARTRRPDAILCDVVMQGMDGYAFLTALRSDDSIADIPVIMLTAMQERSQVRLAMTSGADDHLAKPFGQDELRTAIESVISRRTTVREKFFHGVERTFTEALSAERSRLAQTYQQQYERQLSTHGAATAPAGSETRWDDATVLLVRFNQGGQAAEGARGVSPQAIRQGFHHARDVLYLFGAVQVLSAGRNLVAVFASRQREGGREPVLRGAKAALAVRNAVSPVVAERVPHVADAPQVCVALARGRATVVRFPDPLTRRGEAALILGDAVDEARQVMQACFASGHSVGCTDAVARLLEGQVSLGASLPVAGSTAKLDGLAHVLTGLAEVPRPPELPESPEPSVS